MSQTVQTLIQYLIDGNFLGFFQAIYVTTFQSADVFYGLITSAFLLPIYIRTHSVMLIAIIWIIVGSLFLVAMPLLAGIGLLFIILAIGALLLKAFISLRG